MCVLIRNSENFYQKSSIPTEIEDPRWLISTSVDWQEISRIFKKNVQFQQKKDPRWLIEWYPMTHHAQNAYWSEIPRISIKNLHFLCISWHLSSCVCFSSFLVFFQIWNVPSDPGNKMTYILKCTQWPFMDF
jgi:hypothetical protein